jgi:hypothetical protein
MNLMNQQNRLYNENRELKRTQRVAIFGIDKGFDKGFEKEELRCRGERTGRKNESEEKVSESVIRIIDLWKASAERASTSKRVKS